MGNNSAFSSFEAVVHAVYSEGVLTLPLLKKVAAAFQDQDADWGGYEGTRTNGKDLNDIVCEVSGKEAPVKPNLPRDYMKWTSEQEAANERYQEAMMEIFDEVCGL